MRSAPADQQRVPDSLLSTSTSFRADYWERRGGRWSPTSRCSGEGAGGFERIWLRERRALLYVRDAHNLYLETLAEVGPVGLSRCSSRSLVPLAVVRPGVREPVGRACLAAYVALLAHAALDWDWELPAVTAVHRPARASPW